MKIIVDSMPLNAPKLQIRQWHLSSFKWALVQEFDSRLHFSRDKRFISQNDLLSQGRELKKGGSALIRLARSQNIKKKKSGVVEGWKMER